MQHGSRIKIDQSAIARAGLEQEAAAPVAAGFQIDHHADARAPGRITEERASPQHGILFAVGDQRQDGMLRGQSSRFPGPDGFHDDGDAGFVIARARSRRHRIHMRHQHDRGARARRHLADDIADLRATGGAPARLAIAAHGGKRVGLYPEPRELGLDARMDGGVFRRSGGMGTFRSQQPRQHGIGAACGKRRSRCVGVQYLRPILAVEAQKPDRRRDEPDQPVAHDNRPAPCRGWPEGSRLRNWNTWPRPALFSRSLSH